MKRPRPKGGGSSFTVGPKPRKVLWKKGYKLGRVEVKSIGMEAIELPADLMEKRERMVGGGPG